MDLFKLLCTQSTHGKAHASQKLFKLRGQFWSLTLMWCVVSESTGAEDMLNGCHSKVEMAGTLSSTNCPTSHGSARMSPPTPASPPLTPPTPPLPTPLLVASLEGRAW